MAYTGSAADIAALKSELNNDPAGLGYLALVQAGNHQGLADMLNLARVGNTVRRGVRTGIDVMDCIDITAFDALTVARQQYILALVTPVEGVDLSNDVVRANLGACFPAGATRSRLINAADKTPASRGEMLWGVDTLIGAGQVGQALHS